MAAEAVALFLGVRILNGPLGLPRAGVAWVSLVVGVHFFCPRRRPRKTVLLLARRRDHSLRCRRACAGRHRRRGGGHRLGLRRAARRRTPRLRLVGRTSHCSRRRTHRVRKRFAGVVRRPIALGPLSRRRRSAAQSVRRNSDRSGEPWCRSLDSWPPPDWSMVLNGHATPTFLRLTRARTPAC